MRPHLLGDIGVCATCGGRGLSLTTECYGGNLDLDTLDQVERGETDFRDNHWQRPLSTSGGLSSNRTLRDEIALAVLPTLISQKPHEHAFDIGRREQAHELARYAYTYANAMLEVREEDPL